jgi:hypothetical protein
VICREDGCLNDAHPDKDGLCYKHSVSGVGVTFNGPIRGRRGWNRHTVGSYHEEAFGQTPKQLARTNPNVERYTS